MGAVAWAAKMRKGRCFENQDRGKNRIAVATVSVCPSRPGISPRFVVQGWRT